MVGLRPTDLKNATLLRIRIGTTSASSLWNCPDLSGGIATLRAPGSCWTRRRRSWSFPDLSCGITTRSCTRSAWLRSEPWNFPDLYGGIATPEPTAGAWAVRRGLWNLPDLYGGIRPMCQRPASLHERISWSLPDLYGSIAAYSGMLQCLGLAQPWSFPDQYGGIATSCARRPGSPNRRGGGTSLICTVGLRLLAFGHTFRWLLPTWNFP